MCVCVKLLEAGRRVMLMVDTNSATPLCSGGCVAAHFIQNTGHYNAHTALKSKCCGQVSVDHCYGDNMSLFLRRTPGPILTSPRQGICLRIMRYYILFLTTLYYPHSFILRAANYLKFHLTCSSVQSRWVLHDIICLSRVWPFRGPCCGSKILRFLHPFDPRNKKSGIIGKLIDCSPVERFNQNLNQKVNLRALTP